MTLTMAEAAAGQPGRRSFGVAMLLLATVVGVLVGFAAGVLVLRPSTPGDTSADAGFARDMSLHHAQAVEMGMIAAERATLPQVRSLGGDIALTQQAQIGMMQQWLRDWGLLPTGTEPPMAWMPDGEHALVDGQMPGMATPEQMRGLRAAEAEEVDRLFLELMITHHLGGIHMADGVLAETDNDNVRFLAESMKAGQQKEIQILRDYQALLMNAGETTA